MKKQRWIFIIALILVVFVTSVIILNLNKETKVGVFSLSDFQTPLSVEQYRYPKNVGVVESPEEAMNIAIELWKERELLDDLVCDYSKTENLEVSFDDAEQCWHINGKTPRKLFGGMPHVLVRKSGEVLAVWVDD